MNLGFFSAKRNIFIMMNAEEMAQAIDALSQQIFERVGDSALGIVGIRSRGDEVAERVCARLEQLGKSHVNFGVLDISLYRDDYSHRRCNPALQGSEIDFEINGAHIVLIDDVLFTGRTIMAAISALNDYGRPARVDLGVLIDRGWRELPIAADFVGKTLETTREDKVVVQLQKTDGVDRVELLTTPPAHNHV